jgi:hypothetical protein
MLATTKQVRTLAKSLCTVGGRTYTDVSTRRKGVMTNLRNIAIGTRASTAQQEADKLRTALFIMGYTNAVRVTYAQSGCWLRINKCILEA